MAYRKRSAYEDGRRRTYPKISQTQSRIRYSVPRWEKEFCSQVGGMQWKDFLKAKKYTLPTGKIMLWNDSEGKECFYSAKYWFWALNYCHTPYYNTYYQNPDKYIDKIDWNSEIDPQLVKELEAAIEPVPYDHEEENAVVSMQEIKPIGWDLCEDWTGPRSLGGLIVGEEEDEFCMGQQELANGLTNNW